MRAASKRKPGTPAVELLRQTALGLLETVEAPLAISGAHQPFVILAVGVNGTGKTTTVGKLAHRLKAQGHTVLLAAADTFRAAAVEQLQEWGERARVPVVAQEPGADPAAVVHDALVAARTRGIDVVLADTAGRLHTAAGLMDELDKIRRVIQRFDATAPHETLLVLDASQGQNALAQALKFHERLEADGSRDHEARRDREGRHPVRDRAAAQGADPARRRRRRRRGSRRFSRRRVRAGAARRRPFMIRFENVHKRYRDRPRGAVGRIARDRARRVRVPDGAVGRGQEHAAALDRV